MGLMSGKINLPIIELNVSLFSTNRLQKKEEVLKSVVFCVPSLVGSMLGSVTSLAERS